MPLLGASINFAGVLIFIFSFFMPKKSKAGVEEIEKILGFKEFLKTAEEDRINFFQKLRFDEKQDQKLTFEKILPIAIVLGVGTEWATMFKDIYANNESPSWYHGHQGVFNPILLTDRLSSLQSTASSAFTAKPSSAAGGSSGFGGGGFSGGGFGGGGGGSW